MKDAGGEKSEAIRLSLTETDTDVCRITFLPDMEWLGSENRLFPVVIDPVTTTSKKLLRSMMPMWIPYMRRTTSRKVLF